MLLNSECGSHGEAARALISQKINHRLLLDVLISSRTRIKLLIKLFLNSNQSVYLRSLSKEFNESSNAFRIELNRLEAATLVKSFSLGNKKMYKANRNHPLFHEIHNIVLKHLGIDQIIQYLVSKLGDVRKIYLTGSLAKGISNKLIDVVFVGDLKMELLGHYIEKAKVIFNREIRYLVISSEKDYIKVQCKDEFLLLWESEKLNFIE